EREVSIWCAREAGLETESLGAVLGSGRRGERPPVSAADLDGVPDPERKRKLWGRWLGREAEFYDLCGRAVEPLGWTEVERSGGAEVAGLASLTRAAFREMQSDALPERLVAGPLKILSQSREAVRAVAYGNSDPLDLDPAIMEVLPFFDG